MAYDVTGTWYVLMWFGLDMLICSYTDRCGRPPVELLSKAAFNPKKDVNFTVWGLNNGPKHVRVLGLLRSTTITNAVQLCIVIVCIVEYD